MKNKNLYISITFLVLFIINTLLVVYGKMTLVDEEVHLTVISNVSEFTSNLMHAITFLGSTFWMIGLCLVLFIIFMVTKHKKTAFSTAGILVVSTIFNNVVKYIIQRPRPEYITVKESTFSYPSGHMMASVTLYGFLVYLLLKADIKKTYKVIFTTLLSILTILIGTSRIYLGAHFFSDIFGGALLSLSIIFFYVYLDEKRNLRD